MPELLDIRNIDRSSWSKFRFEQIARSISERVEPKETTLDIYVGLEHLDPDTIHIRRTGKPSDVDGTKLKFYKGDVIFGRRRAYQRKAALAEFNGICSAHSLVLRANPEVIDPKLFPFFLHSDLFMHRAIDISVGSLSPTINWGTLRNQEFSLPPKEQQVELAELLWAGDEVCQKEQRLYSSYLTFYERYLNDLIDGKMDCQLAENWRTYKLGDLGNSYGGLSGKNKSDFGEGSPFITYMNIFSNDKIDPYIVNYVRINEGEKQNKIQFGDIFFTGSSETPEEVGMSSVLLEEIANCYLNSFCFGFRLKDFNTIIPEYARFYFRSREIRSFMTLHAQGYTRHNISKNTILQKLMVKLPDINRQKEIARMLENAFQQKLKIDGKLKKSKEIVQRINNNIFCDDII